MGRFPDCVRGRLKTSQNVPLERKPENVGFLKNQFPVQFVRGEGGAVLCVSMLLKY